MIALAHATLQRVSVVRRGGRDSKPSVVADGAAIEVQFNPASLKVSRRNNVDRSGVTTGTQKRNYPSQEGSTLSFDLEFDTAEQGTVTSTADGRDARVSWVSVRRWTAIVRQFVEPPEDKPSSPPPAVRFRWGTLTFTGLISEVTEDLEHFAPDGTPLRAKISVSISEQNFEYEANASGPGARDDSTAIDPEEQTPGTSPGSSGTSSTEQVATAQAGESAQQLLARLGLDPEAWRGAMSGLTNPLALAAGQSVQLGPEVRSASASGAAAGFAADPATASPDALQNALQPTADAPGPGSGGFVLSAAGGVTAAAAAVTAAAAIAAASTARAGFDVPALPSGPVVDARSSTYGRSVPLRARVQPATADELAAGGRRSVAARARRPDEPPAAGDTAPWERLPPRRAGDASRRR